MPSKSLVHVAGAGGGKPKVPRDADDTLRSGASTRVTELLCEGPIEGFATTDPRGAIYLNDTPVMSSDGTVNFKDFTYSFRAGEPNQQPLEGFDTTDVYVPVAAPLWARVRPAEHGTPGSLKPVTRQVDNIEVTHLVIVITISELWARYGGEGASQSLAHFTIETRTDATGWAQVGAINIGGKSRGPFQRSARIELPAVPTSGPTYRQVRVTKIMGGDSGVYGNDQNGGDAMWDGYTEQISTKMVYPNTAVLGFRIDAEQFSSIPSRKYLLNMLKVALPTGYVPRTASNVVGPPVTDAVYPGFWDGSFTGYGWTDNPAYCLRDLLLSKRYGLGEYLTANQIDDAALYQIGRYCDELVPNGLGGFEPRFTLNCVINNRDEALDVVRSLLSVFRGMGLWDGTKFTIVQDRPGEGVTMQYTPANVEDGTFNYQGSSSKHRHTVAVVAWVNPEKTYQTDYEYVEDSAAILRYGVKKLELTAFGCTSRAQAQRVGRWALYSELYETEIVTFTVGLDSMLVRPGDVIQIMDPGRLASPMNAGDESDRMGGRLIGAAAGQVTLDAAVTLLAGETYNLSVILPDGSVEERQCYVSGTALLTGGTGDTLSTLSPFSATPNPGAIWLVYRETLQPFIARVLSVTATDGHKFTITAHKHYPDKYAMVENGLAITQPVNTNLPDPGYCPPPSNVTAQEVVYTTSTGITLADIEVSWTPPASGLIVGYEVAYRGVTASDWTRLPRTALPTADIQNVQPGEYEVQVSSVNYAGTLSVPVFVTTTSTGKVTPPGDLVSFVATGQVMQIGLRWTYPPEKDLKLVELWAATVNDRNLAIKLTELAFPQDTYTHLGLGLNVHMYYWMRVKDTSGNYSGWVTADAVTVKDPSVYQQLLQDEVNRSMLIKDLLSDVDNPALAILDLTHRVSWMSDMLRDLKTKSDAVIEVDPANGTIRLKTMSKLDNLATAIRVEMSSRIEGDAAVSRMVTQMGSTSGDLAAAIESEAETRANAYAALAKQINTVSAASAKLSATVQHIMRTEVDNVTGKVNAVYEVKVQTLSDGKKVISGFGLKSDGIGSEFTVLSDRFYIVAPGSTTLVPMFGIDNSGGTPKVVVNGNLITVGTISASGITAGTLSADIAISTGSIKSNNYVAGSAGWKIDAAGAEFSNALFRGSIEASNLKIGAGGISLKSNGVDINATAFGQVVCQDVSGSRVIADAHHTLSAPNGPLTGAKVTFYGPGHGNTPPIPNRVRTGNVLFSAHATAVMDHYVALLYRTDGGPWLSLHYTQEPNNGYGAVGIQYSITLSISSMTTVQFALCPTDAALNITSERAIIDGSLTVTAYNL